MSYVNREGFRDILREIVLAERKSSTPSASGLSARAVAVIAVILSARSVEESCKNCFRLVLLPPRSNRNHSNFSSTIPNPSISHIYCGFLCGVIQRHSRATNLEPHFRSIFTRLRKDNVANYASIWTLFSSSVKRMLCTLQRTKHFADPSVGGATTFANLRWKFFKR